PGGVWRAVILPSATTLGERPGRKPDVLESHVGLTSRRPPEPVAYSNLTNSAGKLQVRRVRDRHPEDRGAAARRPLSQRRPGAWPTRLIQFDSVNGEKRV